MSPATIEWPSIDFVAGNAGRDVVLCRGPEPSLRWRAVLGEIVDAATRLGVAQAFTLAGIPSMVSHRRPVPIMSTATSRDLVAEVGAFRNDYVGPTGAQTALQVMLGAAGVPTVALWAQVPHYVAQGASPPAIRALLSRLRDLGGLSLDLTVLDEQADAYVRRIEEGIADRPDVAEAIAAIESSVDATAVTEDDLPSGTSSRRRSRNSCAVSDPARRRCRRAGGPGQGRPDRPTTVHSTPVAEMVEARTA